MKNQVQESKKEVIGFRPRSKVVQSRSKDGGLVREGGKGRRRSKMYDGKNVKERG